METMSDSESGSMSTGETAAAVGGLAYLGSNVYGLRTHTPAYLRPHMQLSDRVDYFIDEILKPESWVAGPWIVYDDASTAVKSLVAAGRQEHARRRALQEPLREQELNSFHAAGRQEHARRRALQEPLREQELNSFHGSE
jgi:hypothetical protein